MKDTPTSLVLLRIGDRVILHGLKSQEYNGKVGVVKSLPSAAEEGGEDDQRYGILLLNAAVAHKPVAIRRKNISLVSSSRKGKKSDDSGGSDQGRHRYKPPTTTEEQRKERDSRAIDYIDRSQEHMTANQMELMRMMMNMFLTEEKQIEVFGRIIFKKH